MNRNINPLGLFLFILYLLLYLGFVLLTAFSPTSMSLKVLGEVNLAVTYGFGLIIAAFVMAVIYGLFGKSHDHQRSDEEAGS